MIIQGEVDERPKSGQRWRQQGGVDTAEARAAPGGEVGEWLTHMDTGCSDCDG